MSTDKHIKIISQNRRAYFDYEITEKFESGLVLLGSEIKSLRAGKCSINEAYVTRKGITELELVNAFIPTNLTSSYFNHDEKRSRKLLLHRREINKIIAFISKKGFTAIPLKLYFKNHKVKLELGLAKGKTEVDKRHSIKERDWKREQSKVIKAYNVKS